MRTAKRIPAAKKELILEQEPADAPEIAGSLEGQSDEDALKKLRRAVGKEVCEQSDAIAKSLVAHTVKGNSNTARIVVGLVDKKRKSKAELKKLKNAALKAGNSTAFDLANDPEYQDGQKDEVPEAQAETREESEDLNADR